jgi:nucleoside-diphosphate kinase
MNYERTLVLIKPDGLYKSLTGAIITDLSSAKLKIVGAKVVKVSRELAQKHYNELECKLTGNFGKEKGCQIYENILEYIQGKYHTDRVLALVYAGENAIEKIRKIAGETHPEKAEPTSTRGKYGRFNSEKSILENVIHCSDSVDSANREIELWFSKGEIVE